MESEGQSATLVDRTRRTGKKTKICIAPFKIQPPTKKRKDCLTSYEIKLLDPEPDPPALHFEQHEDEAWEWSEVGNRILLDKVKMCQLSEWFDEAAAKQEIVLLDHKKKGKKKEKKGLTGKRKASKVKGKVKAKKAKKKASKAKASKKKNETSKRKTKPSKNKEPYEGSSDKDASTLTEQLRLERIKSKCEDGRFSYCAYPVDKASDLKVSLVINLYPNGFSLGSSALGDQGVSYPYDSSTSEFVRTIDYQRLPPDFVELLEEVPCTYYDGCLLVEVRDHRPICTSPGVSAVIAASPTVHRVLLKPDTETLINDVEQICSEHEDWTTDDCLQVEQSVIQALGGPLCLDPNPKVARVANIVHYNKVKAAVKTYRKAAPQMPGSCNSSSVVNSTHTGTKAPLANHSSFALLNFLNQKGYRPRSDLYVDARHSSANKQLLRESDKSKEVTLPNASVFAQTAAKSTLPQKRAIRFHGRDGRTYCYFELRPKMRQNGYEAVVSEGMSPEHSRDTAMKFPVGSSQQADAFFHQVKLLNIRDGKICIFDSSVSRPMLQPIKPVVGALPGQVQGQVTQGQPQILGTLPQSVKTPLAHPMPHGNGAQPSPYPTLRQGNVNPLPSHPPSSSAPSPPVTAAPVHTTSVPPQPSLSTTAPMSTVPTASTSGAIPPLPVSRPNLLALRTAQPALYNQIISAAQQRSQQTRAMHPRGPNTPQQQQPPQYNVDRSFLPTMHTGYGGASVPYTVSSSVSAGPGQQIPAGISTLPTASGVQQAPPPVAASGVPASTSAALPLMGGYPRQTVIRHAPSSTPQGQPLATGVVPHQHPHGHAHGHTAPGAVPAGQHPMPITQPSMSSAPPTNRLGATMTQAPGHLPPQQSAQPLSSLQMRQAILPQASHTMVRQGVPSQNLRSMPMTGPVQVSNPAMLGSVPQHARPTIGQQPTSAILGQNLSGAPPAGQQFHPRTQAMPQERKFMLGPMGNDTSMGVQLNPNLNPTMTPTLPNNN